MMRGSMSCIKYLLFILNFIFVICGTALVAVGVIVFNKSFSIFPGSKYITAPTILIIVGVAIFIVAFFGCCGALKESRCMVMAFGLLLFIIFVVEMAGGISAYVYKEEVESFLRENLNSSLVLNHNESRVFWDDVQNELYCCGITDAEDYVKSNVPVPDSCCANGTSPCTHEAAFNKGCYLSIRDILMKNIAKVGGVAVGLGAVELIGCIMAWYLAASIKRDGGTEILYFDEHDGCGVELIRRS